MAKLNMLLPADVVLVRGKTGIGWGIRWFTRGRDEAPTRVNHAELISVGGSIKEAYAIGAVATVKERPLLKAKGKRERVEIWRHLDLTDDQRAAIVAHARSYLGRPYGGAKIIPQAIDGFLGKIFGGDPYLARRLCLVERYPICSYLDAVSYDAEVGYRFKGVPPQQCTPDDIDDDVLNHSYWVRVAVLEAG